MFVRAGVLQTEWPGLCVELKYWVAMSGCGREYEDVTGWDVMRTRYAIDLADAR